MTFGRHHVYTFDKRYFRFPGIRTSQCQFLVARDFKDGNFTILASSHSITVITRDAVVRIYRDGLVKSQGIVEEKDRRMLHAMVYDELPMQFENTTIVRDGPYINLTNDLGFSLECDMEHFLCSYNVSGFYHNRTAGKVFAKSRSMCLSVIRESYSVCINSVWGQDGWMSHYFHFAQKQNKGDI